MNNRFLDLLNRIKSLTGLNLGIGYVTFAHVGGNAIFAMLWITLASILSVEEYGKISYLLAISIFGVTFSVFGLRTTLITYLAKGILELKNEINSLVLITSISIAVVTLIIFQSISIFIIIITLPLFWMSTGECIANKKYKEYVIITIGSRTSQFVLTLIFYYIGGIDLALVGFGIATIPFSYRYFSSLKFFKFKFKETHLHLRFVVQSFSLQLGSSIQWYDKFLVAPLFGFYILGQYQIGIQILLFVGMIPQILFHYLLPQHAIGISHTRIKYTGIMATIFSVIIIWISLPFILENIFPKYVESILTTQIILLGAIPFTIIYLLDTKFLGLEQSKYVFYGVLLYLGIQTLSILTLGLAYQTIGLAFSLVLALSSQASYLFLIDRFVIGKLTKNSKEK